MEQQNAGIVPFISEEFGQLRTITKNGQVLFCGKDVATALGYQDPTNAVKLHCKGVANYHPLETAGGIQQVRFITEGDLYRMIASSKLPGAEKFESWVFDEVLPTIRKHGMYATEQTAEQMLNNPDFLIKTLEALKTEREQRRTVEAELKAIEPKRIFADAVASSSSTILVGELAKILRANGVNVGQNRLYQWMREKGYLVKRKGSDWNMPMQRSMDMGLFDIKETAITHADGHVTVSKTVKVTGKGQQYFINLLTRPMAQ